MTSKEYVIWLKGFVEACHEYAPTPKQWDALTDKLKEVKDEEQIGTPIGIGGWGTPNTAPIQTLPFIQPYNPYNPYTINCGSGSSGTTITTTPGGGSITYATPQVVTSTAYGYPSGSTISYTNNAYNPPYTTGGEDETANPHNED
jgi:hypothetical protein